MILLYHYSHSFADDISPEIVRRVACLPTIQAVNLWQPNARVTATKPPNRLAGLAKRVYRRFSVPKEAPRLLALGSIILHAKQNDVIWGTGSKWTPSAKLVGPLDIRAVRGPLTRRFLREVLGVECPEVYGDPALLMPLFFPEFQRAQRPTHDYTVILQHNDEPYVHKQWHSFHKHHIVLCQRIDRRPWQDVVRLILDSKYIISSSLHGLIIAEAFGIPARWWRSPDLPSTYTEQSMKFNDYYLSTGRKANQFCSTVEEALHVGALEGIKMFDSRALVDSFPYEFFEGAKRRLEHVSLV